MTVEERYAPDDGVRKVHHQIDASFDRNVYCIQPLWMIEAPPILSVSEKVNLMNEQVRPFSGSEFWLVAL